MREEFQRKFTLMAIRCLKCRVKLLYRFNLTGSEQEPNDFRSCLVIIFREDIRRRKINQLMSDGITRDQLGFPNQITMDKSLEAAIR